MKFNIKSILLALLLSGVLVFSGCSTGTNAKQNGFDLSSSFKGGTQGLAMSFDTGLPPSSVKDQGLQPFNVRVMVQNMGEFDIPSNSTHVTLTGFDPKDLNLSQTSKLVPPIPGFKVQGTTQRSGGEQGVIFTNLKYMNSVVSGSYPITIDANICYPYQTSAIAQVCIAGNTFGAVNQQYQNCQIQGTKKFANSGAPVQIANVQEYANAQNSVQIEFDIVHSTTKDALGSVFAYNSLDANCNVKGGYSPDSYQAINSQDRVTYTINTGIPGLNCDGTGSNSNTVLLTNDKYTVSCIQNTTGQGQAHAKLINIKLKYDYFDRISKTITVEHVN